MIKKKLIPLRTAANVARGMVSIASRYDVPAGRESQGRLQDCGHGGVEIFRGEALNGAMQNMQRGTM